MADRGTLATITTEILVPTNPERCFDLARDIDLHVRSLGHTGERAIGGRTSGLIELGEEVTWEARHFGVLHQHTARITAYDRPRHFRDSMVAGRFALFEHDHFFDPVDGGVTRMRDVLTFRSPFGPLGWLVDRLVLARYLRNVLESRGAAIRAAVEAALLLALAVAPFRFASAEDAVSAAESAAKAGAETPGGKEFADALGQAFGREQGTAIQGCAKETKRPDLSDFHLLLRLDERGVVDQAVVKPSTNLASCVQRKVLGWKTSVPPRAGFWVKVGVNLKKK
jgi:ligand-binding SRPBCC domain-containing protein